MRVVQSRNPFPVPRSLSLGYTAHGEKGAGAGRFQGALAALEESPGGSGPDQQQSASNSAPGKGCPGCKSGESAGHPGRGQPLP